MNRTLLLAALFVLLNFPLLSQTTFRQWHYGTTGEDRPSKIVKTDDGGRIIIGTNGAADHDANHYWDGSDLWVIKTDSAGNIQWQYSYGGTQADAPTCIGFLPDDKYIVAGYSWSRDGDVNVNYGCFNIWVVRLDSNGAYQFDVVQGSGCEQAYAIKTYNDGSYILAGYTESDDGDFTNSGHHGYEDFALVKVNNSGNVVWAKQYGGSNDEEAYAMVPYDNGFYVIGHTKSTDGQVTNNHGNADIWVVKTDLNGNFLWGKTFGGSGFDKADAAIKTFDGNILIVGVTYSNDGNITGYHNNGDICAIKIDTAGNLLWEKTIGGEYYDEGFSVKQLPDSTFIIVGTSMSNDGDIPQNFGKRDYIAVRLSNNGQILNIQNFGGSNTDVATDVMSDNGNIFIIGYTNSTDGQVQEIYTDTSSTTVLSDIWLLEMKDDYFTKIDQPAVDYVKISPVPAMDYINVQSAETVKFYQLIDLQGRILEQENVGRSMFTVELPQTQTNLLILRLFTDSHVITKKIIVNHR